MNFHGRKCFIIRSNESLHPEIHVNDGSSPSAANTPNVWSSQGTVTASLTVNQPKPSAPGDIGLSAGPATSVASILHGSFCTPAMVQSGLTGTQILAPVTG